MQSLLRTTTILRRRACRAFSSPAVSVPPFYNEPVLEFAPGSEERQKLKEALATYENHIEEIPCVIGGKQVFTGNVQTRECPYNTKRIIAKYHYGTKELVQEAIDCSLKAKKEWENTPFEQRAAAFLKLADLITTKYRYQILATTMIGQGKTAIQAEIDATCELADFYRIAVDSAGSMYRTELIQSLRTWNRMEYRALEGFIASISPFNFTAIGGNLGSVPALMGNTVVWKPSDAAILSNWTLFNYFKEAGIPDGVINWVPIHGPDFGDTVTASPDLAAINFTGSARTFKHLWKQVGQNLDTYRTYPRLVGECGGKNYHCIHPTADVLSVVNGTIKSAFEYCGQKCSAVSRMYVPESLWPQIKEGLIETTKEVTVGPADDFTTYTSCVIDSAAFNRIAGYLDFAKSSPDITVLAGGEADNSVGYFIQPTILQTTNPRNKLMEEEIFGPVVTVYVYPDAKWEETLDLINNTSPYGLTGALYARDRDVIDGALTVLRQSAGNFYINDKSTGSVVGHQPFGGARISGTNDKAGGQTYVMKWVSPQSIKETFTPTTSIGYPSVDKN